MLLWNELKNKKLHYDFHRQKPLLNYIVDFYSPDLDLIIEIDGRYHEHEEQYHLDIEREKQIIAYNLTVLRFTEIEVISDMLNILRTIEAYISNRNEKDTPL